MTRHPKTFQYACPKNKFILLHFNPQEISSDISWYPAALHSSLIVTRMSFVGFFPFFLIYFFCYLEPRSKLYTAIVYYVLSLEKFPLLFFFK